MASWPHCFQTHGKAQYHSGGGWGAGKGGGVGGVEEDLAVYCVVIRKEMGGQ